MKNIVNCILSFFFLFYSVAILGQNNEEAIGDVITSVGNTVSYSNLACPCRPNYNYSQIELDVLYLINQYRQSLSLSSCSLINHISNNCSDHNNYMIANNALSHHYSQNRFDNNSCALNAVNQGEIVAGYYQTAYSVVAAWLASPSHKEAIEDPDYTRIGISVTPNSQGNKFYTVIFSGNTSGSCSVFSNPCSLSPPITLTTSNINYNSVQLNWNNVSGNAGYQVLYKTASSGPFAWITAGSVGSGVTTYTLTGLSPTTAYQWRVRSLCSNGLYGTYSNLSNFTTICIDNLSYSLAINSGQVITKEATNSITSSSTINSGGTGIFHGGNYVLLSNNFHAKSGSIFRAYIDGCNGTFVSKQSGISFGNELDEGIFDLSSVKKYKLNIAPNPNKGNFTIKLEDYSEGKIEITDFLGFIIYEDNFKNQNKAEINIENNPKGIYFVKVKINDGKTFVEKIIKD